MQFKSNIVEVISTIRSGLTCDTQLEFKTYNFIESCLVLPLLPNVNDHKYYTTIKRLREQHSDHFYEVDMKVIPVDFVRTTLDNKVLCFIYKMKPYLVINEKFLCTISRFTNGDDIEDILSIRDNTIHLTTNLQCRKNGILTTFYGIIQKSNNKYYIFITSHSDETRTIYQELNLVCSHPINVSIDRSLIILLYKLIFHTKLEDVKLEDVGVPVNSDQQLINREMKFDVILNYIPNTLVEVSAINLSC